MIFNVSTNLIVFDLQHSILGGRGTGIDYVKYEMVSPSMTKSCHTQTYSFKPFLVLVSTFMLQMNKGFVARCKTSSTYV